MMASITLDTLFLHDATDLSAYVAFDADLVSLSERASHSGEVRTYAGGRQRLITRPGEPRTINVKFEYVSPSEQQALRDWIGVLLLLRDPRGRKVYGVFHEMDVSERNPIDYTDINFAFQQVTASEEV